MDLTLHAGRLTRSRAWPVVSALATTTPMPRLTDCFYRVDRGRSRDSGGTGLGLAIVKHSLNRHQAQLEIKSVLGQGSRFAATFPGSRVAGL